MANAIKDHQTGTTWNGMSITYSIKDDNGNEVPVDLTDALIVANFQLGNNLPSFTFTTEDNTITIPDPTSGQFFFESRLINATPGIYNFDVFVTLNNNTTKCIISDYWTITKHQPE